MPWILYLIACAGSGEVEDLPEPEPEPTAEPEPAGDDTEVAADDSSAGGDDSGAGGDDSGAGGDDTADPEAPEAGPLERGFAVIGDYGNGSDESLEVAEMVLSWAPSFIVTTGDNNYPSGEAETIDENIGQPYHSYIGGYSGAYGDGSKENRFFPSLGNHDWYNADGVEPYQDFFDLPGNERYYTTSVDGVGLFSLDSDDDEPDGVDPDSLQAAWLREALASSTDDVQIVYFHHTAWSSANHGDAEWMQWPFREWGADLVLAGHDHVYERLEIDGLPTITNGAGGYGLYSFGSPREGSLVRHRDRHGAQRVEVTDRLLTFQFIDLDGVMVESFAWDRAASPGANRIPLGASWRYATDAPGDGWAGVGFDDAAWSSGDAPVGHGIDALGTDVWSPGPIWLRATFEAPSLEFLSLGLRADDGAVVYLDGEEIYRQNLPEGEITEETLALKDASSAEDGAWAALVWAELDPALAGEGEHVLAISVHPYSEGDGTVGVDAALVGVAAIPAPEPLLPFGAGWRVLYGEDPGAGWADAGFDDAGWLERSAPWGYGLDEIADPLGAEKSAPPPASSDSGAATIERPVAVYGRATFTLDAVPDAARLWTRCDDGCAVYVNGVEAWRRNLPAGAIAADAHAGYAIEDDVAAVPTALDPAWLVAGENVIAVEVRQPAEDDDGDMVLDLQLEAR